MMHLLKRTVFIHSKKKSFAFTLLELLIALLIFSFVITMVTSITWLGMRMTKRSRIIAQRYTGARVALDFMAREIRSAFDFRFPGYENFSWDSEERVLSLWRVACDGWELRKGFRGPSPIYLTTYYHVNEEGTDIIYRKITSVYSREVTVFEGPMVEGSFELEIREAPTQDPQDLPEAVIIHFKIDGKKELQRTVELPQYKKF